MNATVLESSKEELNLSVTDSDIGTLYIIQHELLQKPGVDFAGVIVKHPLTNECWMRVNAPKGDPAKEIDGAASTAIKAAGELEKLFGSKLKVK